MSVNPSPLKSAKATPKVKFAAPQLVGPNSIGVGLHEGASPPDEAPPAEETAPKPELRPEDWVELEEPRAVAAPRPADVVERVPPEVDPGPPDDDDAPNELDAEWVEAAPAEDDVAAIDEAAVSAREVELLEEPETSEPVEGVDADDEPALAPNVPLADDCVPPEDRAARELLVCMAVLFLRDLDPSGKPTWSGGLW